MIKLTSILIHSIKLRHLRVSLPLDILLEW